MKKKFLFSCLIMSFVLVGSAFCMSPLKKIQSITERDLSTTRVMSPVETITETEKMNQLLQAIEGDDSSDEEILDYIAPVCAQYREKADVTAFDEFAGVDRSNMLDYQIAVSSYYKICADTMSKLIETLLLRRAHLDG